MYWVGATVAVAVGTGVAVLIGAKVGRAVTMLVANGAGVGVWVLASLDVITFAAGVWVRLGV